MNYNDITEMIANKGITLPLKGQEMPTSGYFISTREKEVIVSCLSHKAVFEAYAIIKDTECDYFGAWYDEESKLWYFDSVCFRQNKVNAENVAKINEQIAYYDIENKKEIRC